MAQITRYYPQRSRRTSREPSSLQNSQSRIREAVVRLASTSRLRRRRQAREDEELEPVRQRSAPRLRRRRVLDDEEEDCEGQPNTNLQGGSGMSVRLSTPDDETISSFADMGNETDQIEVAESPERTEVLTEISVPETPERRQVWSHPREFLASHHTSYNHAVDAVGSADRTSRKPKRSLAELFSRFA